MLDKPGRLTPMVQGTRGTVGSTFLKFFLGGRLKSDVRGLVLILLVAMSSMFTMSLYSGSSPAVAAGSTCSDGGNSNHLIGYATPEDTNANGASAQIQFQNPDLCGSDTDGPSASVAWVMLSGRSASTAYENNTAANGWAQSGYGQFAYNGHDIATFNQYTKQCKSTLSCSGSGVTTTWDDVNPGPAMTYKVYKGSDGLLHMEPGVNASLVSDYSPTGVWKPAKENSYAAETLDSTSDIVGVANDRVLFDNLKRYNDSQQWVFQQTFTSIDSAITRYHKSSRSASIGGGYHFTVWTDPL